MKSFKKWGPHPILFSSSKSWLPSRIWLLSFTLQGLKVLGYLFIYLLTNLTLSSVYSWYLWEGWSSRSLFSYTGNGIPSNADLDAIANTSLKHRYHQLRESFLSPPQTGWQNSLDSFHKFYSLLRFPKFSFITFSFTSLSTIITVTLKT